MNTKTQTPVQPINYSQAVADYLVELRDSGETNMWGAGPFVARKFGMSHLHADQCLIYWMESLYPTRR